MQIKRVKCPNCGVVLEVKNTQNETVKLINCPQCKVPLRVAFQPQQPLDAETMLPPKNPRQQPTRGYDDGKTQLGGRHSDDTVLGRGRNSEDTQVPQQAFLSFEGRLFVLMMGVNTVGRKASTSTASLQIPSSDPYMSRSHVQIKLSVLPNGKLKAVVSNDRNKNITTINGTELRPDEAIVLSNGDRIVMGKTTVVFQVK